MTCSRRVVLGPPSKSVMRTYSEDVCRFDRSVKSIRVVVASSKLTPGESVMVVDEVLLDARL